MYKSRYYVYYKNKFVYFTLLTATKEKNYSWVLFFNTWTRWRRSAARLQGLLIYLPENIRRSVTTSSSCIYYYTNYCFNCTRLTLSVLCALFSVQNEHTYVFLTVNVLIIVIYCMPLEKPDTKVILVPACSERYEKWRRCSAPTWRRAAARVAETLGRR